MLLAMCEQKLTIFSSTGNSLTPVVSCSLVFQVFQIMLEDTELASNYVMLMLTKEMPISDALVLCSFYWCPLLIVFHGSNDATASSIDTAMVEKHRSSSATILFKYG